MKIQKGDTALITGASSGIGTAFVRSLAASGARLVLVARSRDKLDALAEDMRSKYGVEVLVVPADLGDPASVGEIQGAIDSAGWQVDFLFNNAGFGQHGRFAESDIEKQDQMIELNVLAVVNLTYAFLPGLLKRKRGAIINVASTAGLQPLPFMAVYGATKAFVVSFSEALAEEVKGSGVLIQTVLPGNTETPFHSKVGETDGRVGGARTAEQVVQTCLQALDRNQVFTIDGFANRALGLVAKLSPRSMVRKITGDMMRKGL